MRNNKDVVAFHKRGPNVSMRGLGRSKDTTFFHNGKHRKTGLEARVSEGFGEKTSNLLMYNSYDLSSPGYIFSSNNSYINYRIGLEKEIINFRRRMSESRKEGFMEDLKRELKDVYKREAETYNILGPIMLDNYKFTSNPTKEEKKALTTAINNNRLKGKVNKKPEIVAEELAIYLLYPYLKDHPKMKNNAKIEKVYQRITNGKGKSKQILAEYEKLANALKDITPSNNKLTARAYEKIIGLIQVQIGGIDPKDAVGDMTEKINAAASDFNYIKMFAGSLAEVVDYVALQSMVYENFNKMQEDASKQVEARIDGSGLKGASEAMSTRPLTSAELKNGQGIRTMITRGSNMSGGKETTEDIVIQVPTPEGTKLISIDVKNTQDGYTRKTRKHKANSLFENSRIDFSDQDKMIVKKVLYLMLSNKAINKTTISRDTLLLPLSILLFTSNSEIQRFLIESETAPTLVTWKGKTIWYSQVIEAIGDEYLSISHNVRYYDLNISVPPVASSTIYEQNAIWQQKSHIINEINKTNRVDLPSKIRANERMGYDYVNRIPDFVKNPALTSLFKEYATKAQNITISGTYVISKIKK